MGSAVLLFEAEGEAGCDVLCVVSVSAAASLTAVAVSSADRMASSVVSVCAVIWGFVGLKHRPCCTSAVNAGWHCRADEDKENE